MMLTSGWLLIAAALVPSGPHEGALGSVASGTRVAGPGRSAEPDRRVEEPRNPTGPEPAGFADLDDARPSASEVASRIADAAVSGNPAAVNIVTGTGALGRFLGFDDPTGVRIGGLWIGDASVVPVGGRRPGEWGLNGLTLADLSLDMEPLCRWRGGLFGIQFLQYAGHPTNDIAGAFPGFESLDVVPPLVRQQLYQLWFRQSFFQDRLIVRLGKSVPTYDFNNVIRPVPVSDPTADIPAVTSLIYTPAYVNPTMLGVIPGYYNSAVGLTVTLSPNERFYLSYGLYDGNLARGRQTGLEGPHFNGYAFHIGEVGAAYRVGRQRKPGNLGVGFWGQTGLLDAFDGARVRGAQGTYLFGTQRLWFRRPNLDNSGVSGFYQFGVNNSNALLARQYVGGGLTAFGLVSTRPDDSFGFGLAWTWLNQSPDAGRVFFPDAPPGPLPLRSNQLMLAWYYQMKVFDGWFFQPNLTYIPNPGQSPVLDDALAVTLRLVVLF